MMLLLMYNYMLLVCSCAALSTGVQVYMQYNGEIQILPIICQYYINKQCIYVYV